MKHPDGCSCDLCRVREVEPGAVAVMHQGEALLPMFYCLRCEQPGAISIDPPTDGETPPPSWEPKDQIHHCMKCGYQRTIAEPRPPEMSPLADFQVPVAP